VIRLFLHLLLAVVALRAVSDAAAERRVALVIGNAAYMVTAIGTKGRFNPCILGICSQWVTAYRLAYSVDGASWQYLEEEGGPRLLEGNSDRLTEVRHDLPVPIRARFLRFHPQSWNMHVTMPVEAYGFPADAQ
jgi:hypothetical protein